MTQLPAYLGISLRYPDASGAFTELFYGSAKPSDIQIPQGIPSHFLNLAEGFLLHSDSSRIIFTYFNLGSPVHPVTASLAYDSQALVAGRPVVSLLAALRAHIASGATVSEAEIYSMVARAGFPDRVPLAPQRRAPFASEGPLAWTSYMSGSDLAAIFTFPCQKAYAPYSAVLVLQPTAIANPESPLPRITSELDRSLWVVCPEGVSVSRNPVETTDKIAVTYTRPGFSPAVETVDVGMTSRFARISGPAIIISTPEKAGIEFKRKVSYSVTNDSGVPVSSHTVLINGRTAVRDASTFTIASTDLEGGKAEVTVSATNFSPVTVLLTPAMLSSDKPIAITLSPERRGTLLRLDFGDGRIFENSMVFEKNDPEYRLLRAGRFHGFRAHRIMGSEPETYNVEVNTLSAPASDMPQRVEPVAPAIEKETAEAPRQPEHRPLKTPQISVAEECPSPAGEETDENTPSRRTARIWTRRIVVLALFLVAIGGLAWYITRTQQNPAAVSQSSFTADSAAAFPDAEPALEPQQAAADAATPEPAQAAAPAEGMGNDLAYFNNNAVWRRADLTTDAGRAFFDTMVSGDIDAIASSDYFAVQGRATNPKAVQIVELLWAAKGTGTQNSNQRVLTARRKSAEINLSEVYELLARYRDANPNTAPRPVKK